MTCFDFEIKKDAYIGEMQAITHFWISKTNTLNSHKRPELFFSTIAELQPMRILDFDAAAEEKLSYAAKTRGIFTYLYGRMVCSHL